MSPSFLNGRLLANFASRLGEKALERYAVQRTLRRTLLVAGRACTLRADWVDIGDAADLKLFEMISRIYVWISA